MKKRTSTLPEITLRDVLLIWGIWATSVVLLIGSLVFSLLVEAPLQQFNWILPSVATAGGLLGLWLLCRHRGWGWRDLGFTPLRRGGRQLLWQIPGMLLLMGIATALLAGSLLGLSPAEESTSKATAHQAGDSALLVVLLAYLVAGPLLEEVMLRGFTMRWLDRVLHRFTGRGWLVAGLSTFLSSLLFAVIHLSPPVMVWTFFLGIGCALLTRHHRSLWAGFLLHLVNNALASSVLIGALFT